MQKVRAGRAILALLGGFLLCPSAAIAQATSTWTSAFQAGAAEYGGAIVAIDADHNQLVTGFLTEPTTFGAITLQPPGAMLPLFVAKRDSAGQWLWAVASAGTGEAIATDISTDAAGNVYLCGRYTSGSLQLGTQALPQTGRQIAGGFVASLTPGGQWRWANDVSADDGDGAAVEQLATGGGAVYATGFFTGNGMFGTLARQGDNGSQDAFVVGLNAATGQFQWVQTGGGPGDDIGTGIATDAAGNVYATGGCELPARFNNVVQPVQGGEDVWVGKLSPAGQWRWVTTAGGADYEEASSVAVSPATAQVAVTGNLGGAASFGAAGSVPAPRGNTDAFLAFLDSAGTWQRVSVIGGAGSEVYPYDVQWAPGGSELVVSGEFTNTISFGDTPPGGLPLTLTSNGDADAFLARWVGGTTEWEQPLSAGGAEYDGAFRIGTDRTIDGQLRVLTGGFFASPTMAVGTTILTNSNVGNFTGPLFVAEALFGPLLLSTPADAPAAASLRVVPNPATTAVRLTVAAAPAPRPVILLDGLGREVRRTALPAGQAEAVLDLRGLAGGLYSVRCGGVGQRLVVE
jgi:hypothetical protein